MKNKFIILFIVLLFLISLSSVYAQNQVVVYQFYGKGCPHCAQEEFFLQELEEKYPELEVKSFEIYFNDDNRILFQEMADAFNTDIQGVPTLFINGKVIVGFSNAIGQSIEQEVKRCIEEGCAAPDEVLDQKEDIISVVGESSPLESEEKKKTSENLTFASVITLAIADSVNPCALAVLTMALIALLVQDPRKKRRVIYGGLAFTAAVFITYIFYGVVIIQFFKFISEFFVSAYNIVKIIFASLAILLGIMNIKDFFRYTPGTVGTEMPMFMRPIAKNLIKNITKPRGAFLIGILVTLFLLPCTIGPYVVVGNLLSAFELVKSLPWLIFYNLIFVLPMIGITLFVYLGYTTVEKVTGWKEDNIKYMHLTAGIVLSLLGIAMILGFI